MNAAHGRQKGWVMQMNKGGWLSGRTGTWRGWLGRVAAAGAGALCMGGPAALAQTVPAQALYCGTMPAYPAVPAGALRVTDFGAIPDDDKPDDEAIARALKALQPGGWLVFPPGRYLQAHSVMVTVPWVTLWGAGATLHALDPGDHTVGLRADGVRLYGMRLTTVTDQRRSEPEQSRVSIYREGGVLQQSNVVRGVQIVGAGSAGVLVFGASNFTVSGNDISATLADGIHITGGSRTGRITGNRVRRTGDDLISVVSYARSNAAINAELVSDVLVSGNDVSGALDGRGVAVVGGQRVTVSSNLITNVALAAGVLVAQEGPWNTQGVRDIRIENNQLRDIETPAARVGVSGSPAGHAAIEIHAFQVPADTPGLRGVRDVVVQGNTISSLGYAGIHIGGATTTVPVEGIVLRNNRIDGQAVGTVANPNRPDALGALLDCGRLPS